MKYNLGFGFNMDGQAIDEFCPDTPESPLTLNRRER
jgi:hypothetical protein